MACKVSNNRPSYFTVYESEAISVSYILRESSHVCSEGLKSVVYIWSYWYCIIEHWYFIKKISHPVIYASQVIKEFCRAKCCLLYTSDAADEEDSVDIG